MRLIVFEDETVPQLFPTTLARPAYAISCGARRLVDWIEMLEVPWTGVVRPYLADLQQQEWPRTTQRDQPADWLMLVNARLVPSVSVYEILRQLIRNRRPCVVMADGQPVVISMRADAEFDPFGCDLKQINKLLSSLQVGQLEPLPEPLPLFEHPHDIVRHNLSILKSNLEFRIANEPLEEVADGVFTARGAKLGQYIVSDTSEGPIVLDQDSQIGPYCYLSGPVFLGAKARVIEHSAIKDAVSIGHTTKIGGEVEASVIEPFTNKQHHGFLGHSYLGSWINLGAGTCNSDLKNTYGEVKMEYHGRRVASGMQFVGCIMGDYSKTAINTSIFTGKTVGVCSMLYGFVTTNVPSFVNYARSFGQVTELPPEVMVATQERMFVRRRVTQRECDARLLEEMYKMTRHERQLAGEPLSL